jgi:methionyl aminopeptidase
LIEVKSEDELRRISSACRIVAETLQYLEDFVVAGVSTGELERKAEEFIRKEGGVPAFKGYRGYPASICTSLNSQVVHGIPSEKTNIREGDIISIDLGVIYDGFYGDAAITFPVGDVSSEARRLMEVTEQALWAGIDKAVAGNRVSDIGHAVQAHVERNGFSVVRSFVGHGIGKVLHEEPQVPNFGPPGKGARLRAGMTLAIEPMVNAGRYDVVVLDDGWTAVTRDGSLSAHYEHTIAVTADGARVLTTTA